MYNEVVGKHKMQMFFVSVVSL